MSTRPNPGSARVLARRAGRALVAGSLAALVTGWAALAQTTSETLGLAGPVAAVEEYRAFPRTTERQLFQTWAFDQAGLATERVYVTYSFMGGSLSGRQVTSCDAGRILATVVYDADDEPTGQTVHRYDGEGRATEPVTVDADGVETRRIEYERDVAGDVVRETRYQDGAVRRTVESDDDASGA